MAIRCYITSFTPDCISLPIFLILQGTKQILMKGTCNQCQSFNYSLSYLAAASRDLWALFSSDHCWGKKETWRCCWHLNLCLSLNAADDAVGDAKHQQGKIPTFSPSFTELKITQTIKELLLGKVNLKVFKLYLLLLHVALPFLIFWGHKYRYKVGVFEKVTL